MSNVVQLRSTPPLFKAYEEVYGSLESKYCPSFFKSEEVVFNLEFSKKHTYTDYINRSLII